MEENDERRGPGRPKLPAEKVKKKHISVRVTDEEYEKAKDYSSRFGLPVSEVVRRFDVIFNDKVK